MRAVVQRVSRASVSVDGREVGSIGRGMLVFLGVGEGDDEKDLDYMVKKVVGLRIFPDEGGSMNRSLLDVDGEMLVVSQFTLYGDCRKGRRPSFVKAMEPVRAEEMCDRFVRQVLASGVSKVETGVFRAMMDVELLNDGPVTLLVDSKKLF